MGFWGSLWNGIKSVASSVYKAVVAPVVRTVVNIVKPIITPIVNVVKKTYNVVSNVVSKGLSYIGKGISYVTDLYDRGKKWFLEETFIGRKLKQGYDYVMNETFIGKAIKKTTEFIQGVSNSFFQNTWIGRQLSAAKEWFDNTAVGKFVNKFAPVIEFAGTLLGGVGGLVGTLASGAAKVASFVRNPASLLNLPLVKDSKVFQYASNAYQKSKVMVEKIKDTIYNPVSNFVSNKYTQAFDKVKETKAFETLKNAYDKGNDMYKKAQEKIIAPTSNFLKEKVPAFINNIKEKTPAFINNIKEKAPAFINDLKEKVPPFLNGLKEKVPPLINDLKEKASPLIESLKEKAPTVVYHSANALASTYQNIKAASSFLMDKAKETQLYQKSYEKLVDLYEQGRAEVTKKQQLINKTRDEVPYVENIKDIADSVATTCDLQPISIADIVTKEVKSNGVDSSSMIASYAKKYGKDSSEDGLKIMQQKFATIDCDKPRQTPLLNKVLRDTSKIEFKQVTFEAGQTAKSKDYTIEGRMKLSNKSPQKITFEIDSGQVFGCSVEHTSQHVVVRRMKGELEPQEEKQFILEGFCGDLHLKWPYNDKNYTLTSLKLKEFREGMNQGQVCRKTS